jgi:hypothetical protein
MTACKNRNCAVPGGREFTPKPGATGLEEAWCAPCIRMFGMIKFFTQETAAMIRNKYREYNDTALPKEVKLILTQFSREIIQELGEEEL